MYSGFFSFYRLSGFTIGVQAIFIGELSRYFDAYYEVALGISSMGISFGVIVMPLVTQFLLDLYGWRVTILLISALNLHLVVSGALLRPITPLNEEQDDTKNCGDSQSIMPSAHNKKGAIQKIVYYFDLDLFNNINFISYMVYSTFTGYCFTGWLIYLVPHALEIGFSSTASSALATCGGIGNLVANILYPIIRLKFSNKQVV